jgi:hypothetical protein
VARALGIVVVVLAVLMVAVPAGMALDSLFRFPGSDPAITAAVDSSSGPAVTDGPPTTRPNPTLAPSSLPAKLDVTCEQSVIGPGPGPAPFVVATSIDPSETVTVAVDLLGADGSRRNVVVSLAPAAPGQRRRTDVTGPADVEQARACVITAIQTDSRVIYTRG